LGSNLIPSVNHSKPVENIKPRHHSSTPRHLLLLSFNLPTGFNLAPALSHFPPSFSRPSRHSHVDSASVPRGRRVQYPPPLRSAHLLGHYRLKPLHAVSLLFRTGDDGSLAEAEVDCRCSTMSRPQGAVGFSAFFPAAPKAAREKAKEREKTKSRQLDAPSTRAGITQAVNSNSHVRIDDVTSFPPSVGEHKTPTTSTTQSSTPRLDDNESVQGDILNGVGSASSHASTVSSVFSAPALLSTRTTAESSKNMNNLTSRPDYRYLEFPT
jgi:hypothetical protein